MNLRLKQWSWVGLWTIVVYSTLYIARPASAFIRRGIPHYGVFVNTIVLLLALEVLFIIYAIYKSDFFKKRSTVVFLFLAVTIYTILISRVRLAEEKIHFIEYGLLSLLVYRALLLDIKGWWIYLLTFAVVFILGWVDEGIQYVLPNRVYDIRDVVMNGVGGLIGLVFIFIIESDKFAARRRLLR
ncbi:MAG: VanZ family protein [Candidatus Omnitrophota bacterium]